LVDEERLLKEFNERAGEGLLGSPIIGDEPSSAGSGKREGGGVTAGVGSWDRSGGGGVGQADEFGEEETGERE
jgi:hypothetical protein